MTLKECTAILAPFALAMRVDVDAPTFRAYHRVLEPLTPSLLEAALARMGQEGETFWPGAPKILAKAETIRQERMAAHPYERCAKCNFIGTVRLESLPGLPPKYGRCECWHHHQAKLAELGIGTQPLALPAPAREMSRIGESD